MYTGKELCQRTQLYLRRYTKNLLIIGFDEESDIMNALAGQSRFFFSKLMFVILQRFKMKRDFFSYLRAALDTKLHQRGLFKSKFKFTKYNGWKILYWYMLKCGIHPEGFVLQRTLYICSMKDKVGRTYDAGRKRN